MHKLLFCIIVLGGIVITHILYLQISSFFFFKKKKINYFKLLFVLFLLILTLTSLKFEKKSWIALLLLRCYPDALSVFWLFFIDKLNLTYFGLVDRKFNFFFIIFVFYIFLKFRLSNLSKIGFKIELMHNSLLYRGTSAPNKGAALWVSCTTKTFYALGGWVGKNVLKEKEYPFL